MFDGGGKTIWWGFGVERGGFVGRVWVGVGRGLGTREAGVGKEE